MTKRGLNCGGCERHNTVNDVVLCNKCKKCFHYGCVGVTAGIMSQAWWCDLCAIQVDKSEAKEKRHPKTPMEAIAKTRKPAESCDGENKANRAASCEGDASAYRLSIGV
uniref:Zinc finger PHD-type domain-containing protein n=1 Tax=Anopheles coluzzii TaxID=1518534 RepID=A0A8W7PLN3_ANOCL